MNAAEKAWATRRRQKQSERRFCQVCDATLTEADVEAVGCTQCGPIFTLAKIKTFQGREGYGVNATLLRHGQDVAVILDEGNGGQIRIDFYPVHRNLEKVFAKFCATWFELADYAKEFTERVEAGSSKWNPSSHEMREVWIHCMVDTFTTKRKLDRLSKRNTLFRVKGDKLDEWRSVNIADKTKARTYLETKFGEKLETIYTGEVTL